MQKIGLYIGTSGWSYKHWHGIFYPEDLKQDKYLEYYTTRFSSVELNSCFYHLPLKKSVTGWMSRTPDSFRFCLKLSRFITHQMLLYNVDEALMNFFTDFVYLRLHGKEQLYASDYSEDDLEHYAEMISAWLDDNIKVWVFFNNDYHGYAIKNAERLKEILDKK